MKRIYVAGSFRNSDHLRVLANIRVGIAYCAILVKQGHAPYCPWLDFLYSLFQDYEVEELQAHTLAWLDAAHELHVLPWSELSVGTQREIRRAHELGIPVVHLSEDELRGMGIALLEAA